MSIKLMSKVFEMDIPTGQKFVLLALADRAGDDGKSCFPSQKEIAKKTSITIRSVQKHLIWLEENGLLKRKERRRKDGYRTTDEYVLTLGEEFSGENNSGEKKCNSQAKNIRGNKLPTVINNTSEDTSCPLTPLGISQELWEEYKKHRVQKKSKLTPTAEKRAIQKLERLKASGTDPTAVIEQSLENGWTGLFELKEGKNENTTADNATNRRQTGEERNDEIRRQTLRELGVEDNRI